MTDNGMGARPGPVRMPGRHPQAQRRHLDSKTLFGAERELVIRHDGAEYVLRITSQNKLILTK